MKLNLGFLAVLGLSGAAQAVQFQYYGQNDSSCSTDHIKTITLMRNVCTNLTHSAKSFHIGTGAKPGQIKKNCQIEGFSRVNCTGAFNLDITGPSSTTTCYNTGSDAKTVMSVKNVCKPGSGGGRRR